MQSILQWLLKVISVKLRRCRKMLVGGVEVGVGVFLAASINSSVVVAMY